MLLGILLWALSVSLRIVIVVLLPSGMISSTTIGPVSSVVKSSFIYFTLHGSLFNKNCPDLSGLSVK